MPGTSRSPAATTRGADAWPDLVFTTDRWRGVPQDDRYVFWHDIERRRLLIGKTREEVVQLQGTPDSTAPDGGRITYVVKEARREFNMNFIYFLDVRSSGAHRVVMVRIGAD